MGGEILLIIIIGTIIGYVMASLTIRLAFRRLSKRKAEISKQLSHTIATRFFSLNELEEKIVSFENFQQLLPTIEGHIDEFLNHKLNKAMPFLGMFVGDKTIKQLKELFMEELASLFPVIMKNYVGRLKQDMNIEQLIFDKFKSIDAVEFESLVTNALTKELEMFKWMGALAGLIISVIQLLILAMIIAP